MQIQSNRICPTCGKAVTLKDKRKVFCNRRCYRGGEYRFETFLKLLETATPDACVEWPHGKTNKNYGTLRYKGESCDAHRLSFELFVGPLVGDECALHTCDNPPCFNYLHLFRGTRADNSDDMIAKGRDKHAPVKSIMKLNAGQVQEIRDRWAEKHNIGELSQQFGVSRTHIYRVATGQAQATVEGCLRSHVPRPRKRLSPAIKAEIISRYIPYSNTSELAKEYGISRERVKQLGREKRAALTSGG